MRLERIAGLFLFLALSLALFTGPVESAVTLIYFRGTGLDSAVNLEWATGSEFNTAGFRVKRASNSAGPFEFVTSIGLMPAQGDGIIGAEYSVVDSESIVNGTTYYYILVEIESNSTEIEEGPISVTAGAQAPSNTPTSTATSHAINTPTSVSSQTSTATATSQTPTIIPTTTSSIVVVNQVTSTATPQPIASRNEIETSQATSEQITVLNQLPSATVPSGYPSPADSTPIPTSDTGDRLRDAYPEPVDTEELATLYPAPGTSAPRSYPAEIGSQEDLDLNGVETIGSQVETTDSTASNTGGQTASSTIFLWLGFVIALLIFLAGVYGSIVLFTRQRSQGE